MRHLLLRSATAAALTVAVGISGPLAHDRDHGMGGHNHASDGSTHAVAVAHDRDHGDRMGHNHARPPLLPPAASAGTDEGGRQASGTGGSAPGATVGDIVPSPTGVIATSDVDIFARRLSRRDRFEMDRRCELVGRNPARFQPNEDRFCNEWRSRHY